MPVEVTAPKEVAPKAPASSFNGRLNLTNFAYQDDSEPVRRSPRLSTPLFSNLSTPSPKPAKTAAKRKAPASPAPAGSPLAVSASPASNKKQKTSKRQSAGYAPPSTYAHLSHLPDRMAPNLILLFVGLNPGIQTAATQHAYAHATNLFWPLLYSSGITPVRCYAVEDDTMPARFSLGLTNIVSRPSRNGAELSKKEMDDGVAILEEKARRWRPEAMCIVGKSIWESVWRVRHGKAIKKEEFRYGWQDERENMGVLKPKHDKNDVAEGVAVDDNWKGARVFVATSTSGLAATLPKQEKERIWRELGAWVETRRAERNGEQNGTT